MAPPDQTLRPDAALQAWRSVQANGFRAAEALLPDLLDALLVRLPTGCPAVAMELFQAAPSSEWLFLLRPTQGRIHFLRFWQTFSVVMRFDGQCLRPDSLESDVDYVRDSALAQARKGRLDASLLLDTIAKMMCTTVHRSFWRDRMEALRSGPEELNFDQLGAFFVDCLLQAASLAADRTEMPSTKAAPKLLPMLPTARKPQATRRKSQPLVRIAQLGEPGLPVFVHIYDVTKHAGVQAINSMLAPESAPVKLGGLFHVGVEVAGIEWSYGFCRKRPGLESCLPMQHRYHHYRQRVVMPCTHLSESEIDRQIEELMEEYPGKDYDLLRFNCCHFAEDLLQRLGVGSLPNWVHRLARAFLAVDALLRPSEGKALPGLSDEPSAPVRL